MSTHSLEDRVSCDKYKGYNAGNLVGVCVNIQLDRQDQFINNIDNWYYRQIPLYDIMELNYELDTFQSHGEQLSLACVTVLATSSGGTVNPPRSRDRRNGDHMTAVRHRWGAARIPGRG